MVIGKVVLLSRGGMDKDSREVFIATAPKDSQIVWVDFNDGEQKVAKEVEDAVYLVCLPGIVPQKLIENAKRLKLIQTPGQDTGNLPVKYALEHNIFAPKPSWHSLATLLPMFPKPTMPTVLP